MFMLPPIGLVEGIKLSLLNVWTEYSHSVAFVRNDGINLLSKR